jgi:cytochrome P450
MNYSKSQAVERMKMGEDVDRRDFFHYLLKAEDPETGARFTTPELWGESNLLIIAGSDTTSTALANAFFYLVHNPSTLEKATAEVRKTFPDAEEIHSGPELSSCMYIRAVLDEGMRMGPPVGGILPREVLTGGITVDNTTIPAGIVIGTPHYAIHHNPEYYPEPFVFRPERWIADSSAHVTEESVALARSAFCPFSVGPRGCIGKGMAYTELTMSLARVLFTYDMRLAPGTHAGEGSKDFEFGRHRAEEYQLKDSFTSLKDGPMVEFRKRQE